MTLVNIHTPSIKGHFEPTNDSTVAIPKLHSLMLIDFITNIVFSLSDKQNLITVIKLSIYNLPWNKADWFQKSKHLEHKAFIEGILPGISCVIVRWQKVCKRKEINKYWQELSVVQAILVYWEHCMSWQLLENQEVFFWF